MGQSGGRSGPFLLAILEPMVAGFALLLLTQNAIDLKPIASVRHPGIPEMSGIVRSKTYKDVYWVQNDSGNPAVLWPIRLDGTVIKPPKQTGFWVNESEPGKEEWPGIKVPSARNVDWEDITLDGSTLYVSDLGNNGNARKDLGVYVMPEPDPSRSTQTAQPKFLPIRYPDQTAFPPDNFEFDCEAIFIRNHKLYVITKHRKGSSSLVPLDSAKLYRLESAYTDRPNILKKLDERAGLGGWVTGAGLSPSGKTLAVLTNAPVASIWFFDVSRAGEKMLSAPSKQVLLKNAKQAEGICFENDKYVIVNNEQRELFRVTVPTK